jgi:hypothetical protein
MTEILTEIASETTDQNVKDILDILGDLDKSSAEIVNELIANEVVNFEYHDQTIQKN